MFELQNGQSVAASARVASSLTSSPVKANATTQNSGTASGASSGSSSTITANDFLTLLVTELKNQDPTQPTDPNAYIQQLVGVNSLQQLIQINQGLTTLETGTSGSSTGA
jgi:flagellar basal-body rod modification protein FlgD